MLLNVEVPTDLAFPSNAPSFTPVHPPRSQDWAPGWRNLFGERLRNNIFGWPEASFSQFNHRRRFLGFTMHFISDPEAIDHVLLRNKENYCRPSITRRFLAPLLGNGLLNSEDEDWRKQRRIVAPTFSPKAVSKMAGLMANIAEQQVGMWSPGPVRMDVALAARTTTMQVIASALFSSDYRLTTPTAAEHINSLVAGSAPERIMAMLGIQSVYFGPTMARSRRGRLYLRENLAAIVSERGSSGGADDFFGGLIRALHQQFPAEEADVLAVDNAMTFYLAGHETTANALAWTMYLLAAQPALQEEARAEAVAALDGDVATLADRVPLLRQILDEAMRLYPPAPRFDREALAADRLGEAVIAPGDLVSIWPWLIHRHRKLWDNPDAFDHTRFAPEAKAKLHRFQYLPFGGGQRVCVGARFAIVEALIILAHWLAARRFSLPAGFTPYPMGTVTLRPKGGMWLMTEPV